MATSSAWKDKKKGKNLRMVNLGLSRDESFFHDLPDAPQNIYLTFMQMQRRNIIEAQK